MTIGHRRRLAATFGLALALVVGATACTPDAPERNREPDQHDIDAVVEPDTQAQAGGTLRYGLLSDTTGWNPATTVWTSSGEQVSRALFDRLAAFDESGDARPDLAEAVTANDDSTQWEIRLRPGVTLHNGQPVAAETLVANLETYRSSPTTGPVLRAVQSVVATGDLSVLITMNQPWVDFIDTLTSQVGIVADPTWLASGSGDDPVGSGPFTFGEWRHGDHLTVARNPDYWRTDQAGFRLPYLDAIVFEPVPDPDVRVAKLAAGVLDIVQTDSADQLQHFAQLGDESQTQVFDDVDSESPELFVQLNTAVEPFSDPAVRRSIVLGTDTPTFVDVLERDLYEPARGPFDPDSPWYAETDYPGYDPDAARDLVEANRARLGGPTTFTVLGTSDAHGLSALQLLQEQWKNVGIDAVVEVAAPDELAQRVSTGDYQAVLWKQFDGPQPSVDVVQWDPAAAGPLGVPVFNSARNTNPEIGELVSALRAASTNEQRKAIYASIQQHLAVDLPYVWLVHGVRGVIAAEDLVNVVRYTLPGGEIGIELERGTHPLWQVWRSR